MKEHSVDQIRSFDLQLTDGIKHTPNVSSASFGLIDDRPVRLQLQDVDGDGPYFPKSVFKLVRGFLLSLPITTQNISIDVGPLIFTLSATYPTGYFPWSRFTQLQHAAIHVDTRSPPPQQGSRSLCRAQKAVVTTIVNEMAAALPRSRSHRMRTKFFPAGQSAIAPVYV
jgi:hypothetical protein